MHDHSDAGHDHARRRAGRRQFSLAQQGVGVRFGIALGLVLLIWAAILPLVG